MIGARMVGAIAAIVVLGGGAVAFVMIRAAGETARARAELLRAVDAELGTDLPERDELGRLVKNLRRALETDPHADVVRALARVQLALGRAGEAWDTIGPAAIEPGAPVEDAVVGARVLAALHAETGEAARGQQALGLARAAFELDARPAAGFLAWQLAYRTDDVEAWIEIDDALMAEAASLEARTARAIGHQLAVGMASRLGLEGGVEALQSIAAGSGDGRARALSRFVLDTRIRGDDLTAERLDGLDREWGTPPPELLVIMAYGAIAKADRAAQSGEEGAGLDELESAAEILDEVLRAYPAFVEARHLAVLACYGLNRTPQRVAHARWLLANAPERDARRPVWLRLAE